MHGHGELAVVSSGQIYLLGGPAGRLTHVALPARATAPTWSPDHRWLAVRVGQSLYLVRANGRGAHRLAPRGRVVTDAAWSPTRDVLVVASYLRKHSASPHYHVDLVSTAGHSRTLSKSSFVSGMAWSPDGASVAIGAPKYLHHGPERLRWRSRIAVTNVGTGSTDVIAHHRGGILDIAGWTPDGSHILYWPDPMGSGSIAADGLPLLAVPISGGHATHVDGGLTHAAWTAYAPNRQAIATVAGVRALL